MKNEIQFRLLEAWYCHKDNTVHPILRIKMTEHGDVELTLSDGNLIKLQCGSPRWVELYLHLRNEDYKPKQVDGIRTIINVYKLRKFMKELYESM